MSRVHNKIAIGIVAAVIGLTLNPAYSAPCRVLQFGEEIDCCGTLQSVMSCNGAVQCSKCRCKLVAASVSILAPSVILNVRMGGIPLRIGDSPTDFVCDRKHADCPTVIRDLYSETGLPAIRNIHKFTSKYLN